MSLEGKPWRVELPSTRHKLESRWSRSVFVGVRVKRTERIVMDETGTYVVQSVRRVPEEQRYDHRLLQSVRGTHWEPNPGYVSTDLLEPMLIIPQNCQTLTLLQPKRITATTKELATSTSVKQTSKSLVTLQDAQPAKFTSDVWTGTHRGMQETTSIRDDDRRIHSDPNQRNTCETN